MKRQRKYNNSQQYKASNETLPLDDQDLAPEQAVISSGTSSFSFDEVSDLRHKVGVLSAQVRDLERSQEQAREESVNYAKRFERLLRQLPCGVITLDGYGHIEQINHYAEAVFDKIEVGELWLKVIQREFSPQADDGHEISLYNGKRITLETTSLNDGSGQIVIVLDLSETRRLQAQLGQQQRLIEMGKMMASLAHQVRTPLTTAMLYASSLVDNECSPEQVTRYSSKLKNRLELIDQQINDMLIFVRGGVALNDEVNLSVLVQDVKKYCAQLSGYQQAVIRSDISEKNISLRCNKTALTGALSNLVQNSLQSCHGGIAIDIKLIDMSDSHIYLSISDSGPGINAEHRDKIFMPFFTTKSVGTGLGLPIVKTVINAHGGEIALDKNTREGCCFLIQLPYRPEATPPIDDMSEMQQCSGV